MKTKPYASGNRTLHVLNDLICINIHRIAGFEKAAHIEQTPAADLREPFYRKAIDARAYVNDLHAWVIRLGGAPVTEATITGKIYLHWLESDQGGAATEEAYHLALSEDFPRELQELIENQLWGLQQSTG